MNVTIPGAERLRGATDLAQAPRGHVDGRRGLIRAIAWTRIGLITLFGLVALWRLTFLALHGSALFTEPAIDTLAARTWLAGGDPWLVEGPGGIRFGGPPTMLLPYAPLSLLDPAIARAIIAGLAIGAAVAAIRRLQLPIWWILWPPLFEAVIHASFDSLIPLLFLVGAGPIAVLVKPYAAVALSSRGLVVAGFLGLATMLILPWGTFLRDLPTITESFRSQVAFGGLSAWGNPIAVAVVGAAILSTWPRSRLAIPAGLWPFAQLHYGAMALPLVARSPILAAFMAIPIPGAAPAGIVVYAVLEFLRGRRALERRSLVLGGEGRH